jgi:hypothetical protein
MGETEMGFMRKRGLSLIACLLLVWFIAGFSVRSVIGPESVAVHDGAGAPPPINLNQTAEIKALFLSVPSEYVNATAFRSQVCPRVSQFAPPNTMTWTLNHSLHFADLPPNVQDTLIDDAFQWNEINYYNVTLLDALLLHFDELAAPERGYRVVFLWITDGGLAHSWFHIPERPDLFLGRLDLFNGVEQRVWEAPACFGGLGRTLYFDVSALMEATPTTPSVTAAVVELFNEGLTDLFPDFLGSTDSRMGEADTQMYENYKVKVLWFNGAGRHLLPEQIIEAYQNLMPWTTWEVTVETALMDAALINLLGNATLDLPQPLNYTFVLPNGTRGSVMAQRNVQVDLYGDSGEFDPVVRFFFDNVEDYFALTDSDDKSTIPVIFLQLDDDTVFAGSPQAGVSWFPYNVIVVGFQGSWVTQTGESGPRFLTHLLKHEIGHWLSLAHHSPDYGDVPAKIVCQMSCFTPRCCAFCRDARARLSFMAYYDVVLGALASNQVANTTLEELNYALQLFADWQYVTAVETIASMFHTVLRSTYEFHVDVGEHTFLVAIDTPSTLSSFAFNQNKRTMSFSVQWWSGITGFCNVTIPIVLLGGPYTVARDQQPLMDGYDAPENGTHAFICFPLHHATHFIEIEGTTVIPEFQRSLLLFLMAAVTFLLALAPRLRKDALES